MKNREVLKLLQNLPENTKGYIDSRVPKKYAGSDTAGGVATEAAKLSNGLLIVLGAMQGGQRTQYNGSSSQTVIINPAAIGAAYSDHDHNYAGSSTAGGTATEAAKTTGTLTIKTNGTDALTFNGSASKSLDITVDSIGAAAANHTHSNYALTSHTHLYAASKTAGGVATEAAKTTGTLTLQTNGVSAITFNGSSNKSLDITPDAIGAATSDHTHSNYALVSHTHSYAGSSTAGGIATQAAKTTGTLTIQTNGTSAGTFNGSANKTVNITAANIGAAAANHTHSGYAPVSHTHPYAGSETAGGVATEAAMTSGTLTIKTNGTDALTFNGSASKSLDITAGGIGAATANHTHSGYASASHTHLYAASKTAGGVATEAAKTTGTLTIQTNGTSAGTFNGSANKSINITAASIGAATTDHTHSGYASASHSHGLLNSTLCKELGSTTSGGWSLLNNDYQGFLLMSLRTNASAPNWLIGNYSSAIAFGGSDTKGVMSVAYSTPSIKFAGGNGTAPVWNLSISGSSGSDYNMDNFASNSVVFTIQNNVESMQKDVNNLKTQMGNIDAILDEINGESL
nr:MAG TPA: hypothetical protein [Caudoviricetes sp.]